MIQRLERTLATHIKAGQQQVWGVARVCRLWLDPVAARSDDVLDEPVPLAVHDRPCRCSELDRRIAVYVPVTQS